MYSRLPPRSPPLLPTPATAGYSSSQTLAPPQAPYYNQSEPTTPDAVELDDEPLLSPTAINHSGFGLRGFTGRGPTPPDAVPLQERPFSGSTLIEGSSSPSRSSEEITMPQQGYASLGTVSEPHIPPPYRLADSVPESRYGACNGREGKAL